MYKGVLVSSLVKPILLGYAAEVKPVLTSVQVRYWRYNQRKTAYQFIKPVVPVDRLKLEEPVSASLEFDEDMSKARKFEWNADSLNARGFLRYQKEYFPPHDAKEQILAISKEIIPQLAKLKDERDVLKYQIHDTRIKFDLLSSAFSQLNHSVPNSMLYMIESVGDVVNFYTTEIKTTTPYDQLIKNQDDLPPNLHVQKNPVRFHPDTDTQFGGLTAFPKTSTIVSGLRNKKKYKGYDAKKTWP